MKKSVFVIAVLFSAEILAGCATTKTSGSGIKGKEASVDTGKRVLIDYQGATFGKEIPEWVVQIGEGQYSEEVLSQTMPGVKENKVFVSVNRGKNLDFVKQWTDLVDIETEVAGIMERVAGKSVEANMIGSDNDELQKTIDMYRKSLTNVRLTGLQKIASYWIKINIVDNKKNVTDSFYEYYSVWGMDKKIFNDQLKESLKSIGETATENSTLKSKVTVDLLRNVTDGTVTEIKEN